MAVGVFQLTPVKAACLSKCRSPMGYFLTRWHDGPMGALRMGMGHGRFCLGCCWALMVAAFVLGVMNLAWMAVLTVVMCAEKLVPAGATLGRGAGWAALMIGAWLLATGWSL